MTDSVVRGIVVVMGVTGVGKSTVGRLVAGALHVPFLDADDFHDDAAKAKMRAGVPLTDADRKPWLDRLDHALHDHSATGAVLACSALTDEYRQRLTAGLTGVRFVLLTGDPELIRERIVARHGHFAGTALLPSQLDTLDAPADAIVVDIEPPPDVVAQHALSALGAGRSPT
ncbi:MAG: gluconokinase, GntK/IdnK-type [Acidimicrobiia bacterium]